MLAMQTIFFYFINNEWFYESKLNDAIWKRMDANERLEFPFDTRAINWEKCLSGFYFGIRRFFIKEDVVSPESGFKQLLAQNQIDWFHDIKAANKNSQSIALKDNSVYFAAVLSSQKFQDFVYSRVKIRAPEKNKLEKKIPKTQRLNSGADRYNLSFDSHAAKKQLEQMHSKITRVGL